MTSSPLEQKQFTKIEKRGALRLNFFLKWNISARFAHCATWPCQERILKCNNLEVHYIMSTIRHGFGMFREKPSKIQPNTKVR